MHKPISYVVDLKSGCFNCTSHYLNKGGYPRIMVNGKRTTMSRYVYEQYYKVKIPPNMLVMHICDNPSCVNPSHMKLGSHRDNMLDRDSKQRQAQGEKNGRSKLSEVQVEEILRSNLPKRRLAKMYGIDPKVVRQIKSGVLWKHVYIRIHGGNISNHDNLTDMQEQRSEITHHNDNYTAPCEAV